uniref:Uncharacterized protein n=1 Tax=Tetranychus urticae TaxID=32264 RepID=T1KC01_TETUR
MLYKNNNKKANLCNNSFQVYELLDLISIRKDELTDRFNEDSSLKINLEPKARTRFENVGIKCFQAE